MLKMDLNRVMVILFLVLVSISCVFTTDNKKSDGKTTLTLSLKHTTPKPVVTDSTNITNCTETGTCDKNAGSLLDKIKENKDMLMRTFYVLIGVTLIVIVYFIVRTWRIRRRKNRSRKYGLITSRGSDLELAPLDADDEDDEDLTVFEMRGKRK